MRVIVKVSSLSTTVSSLTVIEKHRGLSLFVEKVLEIEIGAKSSLDPVCIKHGDISLKY